MNIPTTAAARTRMIRKVLTDAGYTARVTSSSASHKAQVSTIDNCDTYGDAADYLSGYLGADATVTVRATYVYVRWH